MNNPFTIRKISAKKEEHKPYISRAPQIIEMYKQGCEMVKLNGDTSIRDKAQSLMILDILGCSTNKKHDPDNIRVQASRMNRYMKRYNK